MLAGATRDARERSPLPTPTPIASTLTDVGRAGRRLAELGAAEGAAGNLSVYVGRAAAPPAEFSVTERLELPSPIPELAGGWLVVTGSGRRLRDVADDPGSNLGCVLVDEGGRTARLFTTPRRRFARLTSELGSHLAVHQDQVRAGATDHSAVVHAQPRHVTYLSHVEAYQDRDTLNHRLLRWQPETILNFPQGIGVVPFRVPGSAALTELTLPALREHSIVVWARHGVMARSTRSVEDAVDLVEYLEAAAHYEYLDLVAGGRASGLTSEDLRAICQAWQVEPRFA